MAMKWPKPRMGGIGSGAATSSVGWAGRGTRRQVWSLFRKTKTRRSARPPRPSAMIWGLLIRIAAKAGLKPAIWSSGTQACGCSTPPPDPCTVLVQLPINAALRQQLLVGTGFAQLALVHHQNAVGTLDGGEPVRNHDGGAPFHYAAQGFAHAEFGFGVDAGCGFVQNQVSRAVGQRAAKPINCFSGRWKAAAAFANQVAEAIGQGVDKSSRLTCRRRPPRPLGQWFRCRDGCCLRACR